MIAEALSLDFVGNSTGLQDAVLASQRALQALNRDTSRMSFTLGRVMRTIVAPIAGVILSAFAAKKALADFTNSTLPGVARFQQTMAQMRLSMFHLSSAVGELLAPMAERTANIIRAIADTLEPLIRKLSAAMPSIGAFLKQLGLNLLAALRPLMPTVFGIVDGIIERFRSLNWLNVVGDIKSAWNATWTAIVRFTAPILVRLASLIDTVVRTIRSGLGTAIAWIQEKMQQLGITIPNTMRGLRSVAESIQAAILVAISALEMAVQNLPMLFSVAAESASVAVEAVKDNWRSVGDFVSGLLATVGQNAVQVLLNAVLIVDQVMVTVGENIYTVLTESFRSAVDSIKSMMQGLIKSIDHWLVSAFNNAWAAVERGIVEFWYRVEKFLFVDIDTWFDDRLPDWWKALPNHQEKLQRTSDILDNLNRARAQSLTDIDMRLRLPAYDDESNAGPLAPRPLQLKPIAIDWSSLGRGLSGAPGMKLAPADLSKLTALLEQIRDKFGPGIAGLVNDALQQGPKLIAGLMGGLVPGFFGNPVAARVDPFAMLSPLLFGSREAAMRESNQASKNPLVPLAQQANQLSTEQLILMRAQAQAAQRRWRMANF